MQFDKLVKSLKKIDIVQVLLLLTCVVLVVLILRKLYVKKEGFKTNIEFNNETLKKAVKEYFIDSTKAENDYGVIGKWDTSNVTAMNSLFENKEEFDIDLSEWDVSNVRDMAYMFENCTNFKGLGLSNWKPQSLVISNGMFSGCTNLDIEGDVNLEKWDVSNVTDMSFMFENCTNFKGLGLYDWTPNPSIINGMFKNCTNLDIDKNVNLEKWKVSNVEDMNFMFENCKNFRGLGLSDWTPNPSLLKSMFSGCTNLDIDKNVNLGEWKVSNVTDMSDMFKNCTHFRGLGLSDWTPNPSLLNSMFSGCTNLDINEDVNLGEWNVSTVTNISHMFENCKNFKGLGLSTWRPSNTIIIDSMFSGSNSITKETICNISKEWPVFINSKNKLISATRGSKFNQSFWKTEPCKDALITVRPSTGCCLKLST